MIHKWRILFSLQLLWMAAEKKSKENARLERIAKLKNEVID